MENLKNWKDNKSIAIAKAGMKDLGIALLMYYGIVILLMMTIYAIAILVDGGSGDIGNGSINMSTQTFLFVLGIIIIRNKLAMSQDFCVSRKSCFMGFIITSTAISVIISIVEMLTHKISLIIMEVSPLMYVPKQMFPQSNIIEQMFMQISMSLLFIFFGSMISIIYYRLSIIGKWIFSCASAASIIITITFIGSNNTIFDFIVRIIMFLFQSINTLSLTLLIGSIIMLVGTNLFLRRATVKE